MTIVDSIDNNHITILFRSHLAPTIYVEGFELGKQIKLELASNITLEQFIRELFQDIKEHIGFVALNGVMERKNPTLSEGDAIDVFSQISGG